MDQMREIYELKGKLLRELLEYNQNSKFSKDDAEVMKHLSAAIDHMCNIAMDMAEEDYFGNMNGSYARGGQGGSYRSGSYEGGSYRGGSYEGGGSYARGRGRNARRDSMGRYSSESGYSRDPQEMADRLRDLMEDAPNETVRRDIERIMRTVEQM